MLTFNQRACSEKLKQKETKLEYKSENKEEILESIVSKETEKILLKLSESR